MCRFAPSAALPLPPAGAAFYSLTATESEVSIVCDARLVPAGATAQPGWRGMGLRGPIPFSVTGVLASLVSPLAAARISVFAVATYDTDYLLVRSADTVRTQEILEAAGFQFEGNAAGG